MDDDVEDFIFVGTPIGREEDTSARKRKAAADAGQLRNLPAWKQEVRDEEGRKRFHGAFTGGFSAGYYNTVGSKEGWAPQTFTSSRKNRAEVKQQSVLNFLDEDEKAEMEGCALATSSKFDTFGFTAAEMARKQAQKEQKSRPSIIPGPVPDELVVPASNSIGVELLVKMGWRRGHSLRDTRSNSLYDARREARKAFLAFSGNEVKNELSDANKQISEDGKLSGESDIFTCLSTPVFVLNPKHDLHGLGYDPFKNAPEFRERKKARVSGKDQGLTFAASKKRNLFSSNSGNIAPGFGIGALEELDIEDEDIYDSGFEVEETALEEEAPSRMAKDTPLQLMHRGQNVLSGFKLSTASEYKIERFRPPDVPREFDPYHKFTAPLDSGLKYVDSAPPPEVTPPHDDTLRLLIEGFATLVARCGRLFEDLSKEKNKSNPLFSFLNGGNGHDYYTRKLWEQQQKHAGQKQISLDMKSEASTQKLTAESRGRILGEKPLQKSASTTLSSATLTSVYQFQTHLSDTFTKSVSHVGSETKPFKNDPAKQERFEQFLKDKFEGGLRSTFSASAAGLSEADRARERLDFEAAIDAMQKGDLYMEPENSSNQQAQVITVTTDLQFITSGAELNKKTQIEEKLSSKIHPKRQEFEWRPAPVLCKRFDIMDPFMGKPPPAPRARSRMDALVFAPDFITSTKESTSSPLPPSSNSRQPQISMEPVTETTDKSVQKPVDLYKAIFSDDSDDEESPVIDDKGETTKKAEGANTALNRLVAGDFLESLGKELGLEIPSSSTYISNKGSDTLKAPMEDQQIFLDKGKAVLTAKSGDGCVGERRVASGGSIFSSGEATENQVSNLSSIEEHDQIYVYSGTSNMKYLEAGADHSSKHDTDGAVDILKEGSRTVDLGTHPNRPHDSGDNASDSSSGRRFQEKKMKNSRSTNHEKDASRRRVHSRHHDSSSDSDSYYLQKGDGRTGKGEAKKESRYGRHTLHSGHHKSRSDTESSSDDGYQRGLDSKYHRKISHEKSKKHSKHHRDKQKKHHRSHHSDDGKHRRKESRSK